MGPNQYAVRRRDSSALQPDFRSLWNASIFQRIAYQFSFSTASRYDVTGKSAISTQFTSDPLVLCVRAQAWLSN
jgi:hypothetical protein